LVVLVAGYKNCPNLILAKLQIAITFALVVRIGDILYGFRVEN